ncbi:hypothetical protein [Nocardia sp. NPDC047648]|uniref:hypothetical protein n=1 Tax=Nocardia sp. NPDC047648 TaxID=3155625 RepID=UPI0033EDADA8
MEIEVICSDPAEHRHRVVSRSVDIPDLSLPEWQQVLDREYQPWDRDRIILDTAGGSPDQSLRRLLGRLHHLGASSVQTSGSNDHEV